MNIRKKFLLTPAVLLGMMLLLGIVGLTGMSMTKGSLSDIYNVNYQSFRHSSDALKNLGAAHADVYRLFTWLSNYDESQIKAESSRISSRIDAAIASIKSLRETAELPAEDQKEIDDLDERMVKYRKLVSGAIDMAQVDSNLGITGMQTADRTFTELRQKAETLNDHLEQKARAGYERSVTVFRVSVSIFILLGIAAFALGNFLSFYMSRLILSPLQQAIAVAKRIASGNLNGEIQAAHQDETGELLRSLADMQEKLRGMISGLNGSACELSRMSEELAGSSGRIVKGTSEQHDSASSMAASIEQMSVSINVVSENATDADDAVGESSALTRKGKKTLLEMDAAMQKISSAVNESAQIIENLGRESARISEIVNVIKDIADQTNLLALNAAIEAARAGEQGRGFAVVADEVRKLAERTANSTQEITEMIQSIQGKTEGAVNSMKEGVEVVGRGTSMTAEAAAVMGDVELKSSQVSSKVSEISAALKEQGMASHEIATHVEKIAQMAEQNTNASRNVAESADRMKSLVANLEGMVSQFTV